MKSKSISYKSLLITLTLLTGISKFAAAQLVNSHEFLGTVFIEDKRAKDVKVMVFEGNKCFSEYETKLNGKFIFTAGIEKYYTLQFEKEGYVTKRVVIKTHNTRGLKEETKTYKFDITLNEKLPDIDYSFHDFPATIIEYDFLEKEFNFNEKYTENRLKKIALSPNNELVVN